MQRKPPPTSSVPPLSGGRVATRHSRWRNVFRLLEGTLWGVAITAAAYLGYVAIDWHLQNAREARELRELSSAVADSSRAGTAPPTEIAIARSARHGVAGHGELIGRLEIPSVGISAFVAGGTEALTLRRGVGHIDGTALPGEPGNIALAGHRDTVFRGLRRIRPADRIFLITPAGKLEYVVESSRTVDPRQVEVLADSPFPTLTLVTCYPFDFIGPAPRRFIVRAREVSHSPTAPSDTH